jgi:hypothetical protein
VRDHPAAALFRYSTDRKASVRGLISKSSEGVSHTDG